MEHGPSPEAGQLTSLLLWNTKNQNRSHRL